MNDGSFQLLEHTADMGIEARGSSLGTMLLAAAEGLTAILGVDDQTVQYETEIEVQGASEEELLVNWLTEILMQVELERLVPVTFRLDRLSEGYLRATIGGHALDGTLAHEIKAITWHRLLVRQGSDGWFCRVYVDL